MINRTWQLTEPLDVKQSLEFVLSTSSPSIVLRDSSASFALWTTNGPATVTVAVAGASLEAEADGPGARELLEEIPRIVGLDDAPATFAPAPGPVRDLHLRNRGLRLGSTGRVFDATLPAILGQRVTTDEAKKSYRLIVRTLGEPAPGNLGLHLPPRPDVVAAMSYEEFHPFAVERGRAEIVIEVARRSRRLEEIIAMDRPDAVHRLTAVRGIGQWTSAQVMGAAWGDRDAVPRGDFHLPSTVSWLLAGEPRGTDDRMEELLEPFRPQRRRALLLIKLSRVHAPRYGPRSPKGTIGRSG